MPGHEQRPAGASPPSRRSWLNLSTLLKPFGQVHRDEAVSVLLLAVDMFLILTSYYILKVVREPLILLSKGPEVKIYLQAGQALALIFLLRYYDRLCFKLDRMKAIAAVNLFFFVTLLLLYGLALMGVAIGVAFFLWVGIFNVTIIAQYWAFANDIYDPEQGRRVFAIIGIGSSVGAVAGASLARLLLAPVGLLNLMPIAAALLLVSLGLVWVVHRRECARYDQEGGEPIARGQCASPDHPTAPISPTRGTFRLLKDHYILVVALVVLVLNWVNATGEYLLDRKLLEWAHATTAAHAADGMTAVEVIGNFRADFFDWVNVFSLLLQAFLVSRFLRYMGVRIVLFILPLIALGGYSLMAFFPVIWLIAPVKVAENSVDYSIQNTAQQALFLVVSREAKYKGKTLIDTFFKRFGDMMAALSIFIGTSLGLRIFEFAVMNIFLVLIWLAGLVLLARLHRRREAPFEEERKRRAWFEEAKDATVASTVK